MVVVSYSGREINAKIVYYGPGLSGKTTNLEKIYDSVPETNRGRMVSMKTQTDRTLFFDLLPLDLGELQGMKTRLLLYTVPGQVYYNATRKLVLKGVDAVVFVVDSAADKMAENRESFANLEANLKAYGMDIKTLPVVIQFNKRDLPNAVSIEELNSEINRHNLPWYEAQAANGVGVFETLRGVSKLLLAKISKDVLDKDGASIAGGKRPAAAEAPDGETSADSKTEEKGVGGKLLKYLKRGKGAAQNGMAETPAETAPKAETPIELSPEIPIEPSPFLSDDALIEEPSMSFGSEPSPMNAEEELVLSDADIVGRVPAFAPADEPKPETTRGAHEDEPIGEFERESSLFGGSTPSLPSRRVEQPDGGEDTRRISIPIDLGQLPRSGTITLTVEFQIRVQSDEPRTGSKKGTKAANLGGTFSRELEVIP